MKTMEKINGVVETHYCNGWAYNHNEIRYWAEIISPCG